MFQKINKIFYDALCYFLQTSFDQISLISQPPSHIDNLYNISSNIAMKYKYENFSQIEFAYILKDYFFENYSDIFITIDVIKPGFLNFKLSNKYINQYLKDLYENSLSTIFQNLSSKKYDLNLEFVSCNPTGPMHVGHLRGAILGESIAELLKSIKCNVVKEFYINDGGNQIQNLTFSVFLVYYKLLNLNILIKIDEKNLYHGLYINDLAKEIIQKFDKNLIHENENDFETIKLFSIEYFLNDIKNTLKSCDIIHDVFTSEEKILNDSNALKDLLRILDEKKLTYHGNIEKPDHIDEKKMNISSEDKLLFKSTLFGDEKDRVIQKSDGTFTYFAKDCAYAYHKYQRSKNLVILLGIDHKGHEKKMKAVFDSISDENSSFKIIFYDLVKFIKNGEQVKFSKRGGNVILANDVLKDIDLDVLRFMMLSQKSNTTIVFDLNIIQKESAENPIFYIKYAYNRCISLLKDYKNLNVENLDIEKYPTDYQKIITHLFFVEDMLSKSIDFLDTHFIVFYILKLSELLHILWNIGNKDDNLKFIQQNNPIKTENNLILIYCIKNVIESLFKILKIKNFKL